MISSKSLFQYEIKHYYINENIKTINKQQSPLILLL